MLGGKGDKKEEGTLQWHVCQFTGTTSEYGGIHSIASKVHLHTQSDALGGERTLHRRQQVHKKRNKNWDFSDFEF